MINKTTITKKQKWEEKQLYGYFKQQTSEISHDKTWKCLQKNIKRDTGSLQIAVQHKAIRNNYVKEKSDKMQQNSKCSLCGNRDQAIN